MHSDDFTRHYECDSMRLLFVESEISYYPNFFSPESPTRTKSPRSHFQLNASNRPLPLRFFTISYFHPMNDYDAEQREQ